MQQPMIVPWQQKVNSLCVGLVGCKGCGQEELAEQIKSFADLPLIPDGIEGYMRNHKLIRNTMGNRQILKMYMNVLIERKSLERAALKYVAVDTAIDYVSYLLATMGHDTDLNDQLEKLMVDAGMHSLLCYDIMFIMPFKQLKKGDDVYRSAQHMLSTQGAMESQPIVLVHPIQSDDLTDQVAECLEVIEKVTLVKAQIKHKQEGGLLEDLPQPTRPS